MWCSGELMYFNIGKFSIFTYLALSIFCSHSVIAQDKQKVINKSDITPSIDQKDIEVIQVTGRRNQANSEMTQETEKLFDVAGIANDPLSSVFSMPGVVYAGGDTGGEPAIRGSSPNDNAFYIDKMPVDYIFHMFGDSIFNKNVIRDFSLYPAAFGSQYGNATGGVFDVTLRDPRNQDFTTTIDASMLKTGIMVEGGLTDDQAFYFSYRKSLIHLFLTTGEDVDGETISRQPKSDDYQAKYQWLIGDNQKLTFSATGASDTGALTISANSDSALSDPDSIGQSSLNTRFDQQALSWDYFADNQDNFSVTFAHMREQNKRTQGSGQYVDLITERYNLGLQYKTNWFEDHHQMMGIDLQQIKSNYSFDMIPSFCTDHDADCEENKGVRTQDTSQLKSNNSAFYISDLWDLSETIALDLGMRVEHNSYTKQTFIHPRTALYWYATSDFSINTKFGTYSRFPDMTTALKKIGNPNIKSPKSTHYSVGFAYELNDIWNSSLDFYYKDLGDMALSLPADSANAALHYSNDLSGTARGVEWVVNRELDNGWYGWASISWSKSDRTDLLTNKTTDYYLDTPMLANLVANYQLNDSWDFGLRLTVRSGAQYTPIIGLKNNPRYPGFYLPKYGALNSKTLPMYYRLDLQANYNTTLMGLDAQWNFALINATASSNVSSYSYSPTTSDSLKNYTITEDKGMEMFPSIGLTVQF